MDNMRSFTRISLQLMRLSLLLLTLRFGSHTRIGMAQANEVLVISALIDAYCSFTLVEFTACTDIANFDAYTFDQFSGSVSATPDSSYVGDASSNIPAGSKIYVANGLASSDFLAFFGFAPTYFFEDTNGLGVDANVQLLFGNTVEDVYYATDAGAEFAAGWAMRNSGHLATTAFDISEWTITPLAFHNFPSINANALTPIGLGNYTCTVPAAPFVEPTPAPSQLPTLRPTLLGRPPSERNHNDVVNHHHSYEQTIAPASQVSNNTTFAPVEPPTGKPSKLPRHRRPTRAPHV
jgi:hypothetical protein